MVSGAGREGSYGNKRIGPGVAGLSGRRTHPRACFRGGPRTAGVPVAAEDELLYAATPKIYPQSVRGTFRRLKWAILVVTLGIYYLVPFLRWDRGPNEPDQAVLIDFARWSMPA